MNEELFNALKATCENYLEELESSEYVDDDHEHYIFEAAMELIFGREIWVRVNAANK